MEKEKKRIFLHDDFEEQLKNKKLTKNCLIRINDTREIYNKLVDAGFGFNKGAYTSPQGQSCIVKNASKKYSVWFLNHNDVYERGDENPVDKWKNKICIDAVIQNYILNHDESLHKNYNEEIKTKKQRIIFWKKDEFQYVFWGIFSMVKNEIVDIEKDIAKVSYKEVSDTLVPIKDM